MRYIKNKEDFISKFLSHLGTSAIMDLLLQMVAAPVVTTDQSRPLDQTRVDLAQVSCSEDNANCKGFCGCDLGVAVTMLWVM